MRESQGILVESVLSGAIGLLLVPVGVGVGVGLGDGVPPEACSAGGAGGSASWHASFYSSRHQARQTKQCRLIRPSKQAQ